jgi:RNA polymerase sigma factor (sigma-70 family)
MNIQQRNVMVEKNLALVPLVLNDIRPSSGPGQRYAGLGDWDDAMQVGTIGLMKAAEKFDPEKGFKFSGFATKHIRWSVLRAICEENLIKVPHTALWGKDEEKREYARKAFGITSFGISNRTPDKNLGLLRKIYNRNRDSWLESQSLHSMLRRLEPLDRELFHLVYWEELSLREAGKRCNLSHERVRQRLHVARERLKKWLED